MTARRVQIIQIDKIAQNETKVIRPPVPSDTSGESRAWVLLHVMAGEFQSIKPGMASEQWSLF